MKMPPRPDDPSAHDDALDALFATARARRPDTARAEFGFETRLLARLAAERNEQPGWRDFTTWCWRLLPGFAVVTLVFALWTGRPGALPSTADRFFATAAQSLPGDDDDLSQWMAMELFAPI